MNRIVILPLALLLTACQTSQQPDSPGASNSAPQATYRVAPVVPLELREKSVERGSAVVEFVVDQSGNVIDAYVASTTHPSFGEAALQAILQWKFVPAMQGGKPVTTLMKLPFSFTNSPQSTEATIPDDLGNSVPTK
jgi:TonB family protein